MGKRKQTQLNSPMILKQVVMFSRTTRTKPVVVL